MKIRSAGQRDCDKDPGEAKALRVDENFEREPLAMIRETSATGVQDGRVGGTWELGREL